MNTSHSLFLLMVNLSQLETERETRDFFIAGINEIFKTCEFEFLEDKDREAGDSTIEIKTESSLFGFLKIDRPTALSKEEKGHLHNAVKMLSVFLERLSLEDKLQKEKISLRKTAEANLAELRHTVKELHAARNATLNLVEDLSEEIEKKKKYEQELIKSEEKYRKLFQNHSAVKLIIDPETITIIDANESAVNFYGWGIEEIRNKKLSQINILPEEEIKEEMKRTLSLGNHNFEFRHKKAQGNVVDVEVFSSRIEINGKEYLHSIIHDITEKKRTERALLASERNYRSLIDGMTETIWVIDFEGNLIDVNRTASEVLGYSKEELLSIGIYGVDSFLTKEQIAALVKNMPVDKLRIFETHHKTKDGRIIPVEISSSVIKYQGKNSILSIARDVTNRKKMEEQLRENEDTIRLLFDSTAEGIYGIDTQGNCTFCNRAALKMLGYTEKEVIGEKMHDLIHRYHDDGSIIPLKNCRIHRAFLEGTSTHTDSEVFWKKNKTSFPVEYWSYPIIRNGHLKGAVVTFIDITQKKRDEIIQQILFKIARASITTNALEDLVLVIQQELSRVFNTDNFYMARYRPADRTFDPVVFINEKYALHEWKKNNTLSEYVVKTGTSLLLKRTDLESFFTETGMAAAECWLGVPLMDEKETIGIIIVENYKNPNAYDKGTLHLMEMIAHELTVVIQKTMMIEDLIKAKEKAEESDRLKSAFLANMSHEIRTPMNGILGFLSLLNEPDLDEENRKEYIEIVNKSGQRLLETINDIIEISKIEAGIIEVNNKPVSIHERMNFLLQFFKPQANQKGLELEICEHINASQSIIESDASKIDSILTNLIKNAIKFTNQGIIKIGNYIKDGSVVFYVSDSGRGVPTDRKEAIFDRFVQGDLNLTRAHEGSGLGLAITKAYVHALGGEIWLKSEVGIGSTFFFTIPYVPVSANGEPAKKPELHLSPARQLTILIAEDDEISYKYLESVLSKEDIRIVHLADGLNTVKTVKENSDIDLILMDIKMPDMDGLDATREIRKFNKTVPIIAQTGYALSLDDEKAKEAGCDDYLSKPINRKALIEMVDKYTRKIKDRNFQKL